MKLYAVADNEQMSKKAASLMAAQILYQNDSVLGLATGSTPVGLYRILVDWHQKGMLDFAEIKAVNLDEYKGISAKDANSYAYFMAKHLFGKVNIAVENTLIPDGTDENSERVCQKYEDDIRALGGVDLQLLGIGGNGHIGFNEPGDIFTMGTHCMDLADSTIEANKRFFARAEDVPRQAYTMGINTILQAKRILLLASGKEKAQALYQALYGPITPRVPASILQTHPDVTVIADADARSYCAEFS